MTPRPAQPAASHALNPPKAGRITDHSIGSTDRGRKPDVLGFHVQIFVFAGHFTGKPRDLKFTCIPTWQNMVAWESLAVARILITIGDPAGIGPEIVDQALASAEIPHNHEFEIIGNRKAGTPGKPDQQSATAALEGLEQAALELKIGKAAAVVTAPVCKHQLKAVGFRFPGQTEFFADAFGVTHFGMLLTGHHLTVGLATIHEPLSRVPQLLSVDLIVNIGTLTARFLHQRDIKHPRIAVAGLNPHAGEKGEFGDEEERIIQPAIEALNALGIAWFKGPGVPDAIFRDAARGTHDAVLAMYHDQGLIPLKLLDFDNAVNVTLGLPVIRTSPDHGTAFDIAGKGIADPSSMISAIKLACELAG
jgi:4-hydroxythreonine-4-phosphate dehydrogenase